MRLQKFGHACLLVDDGDGRVLIDPGTYSTGLEELTGLSGILITHQHPDHVDIARLPRLLQANPDASLHCDEGTVQHLADRDIAAGVVHDSDELNLGIHIRVVGHEHAVVHPDVPRVPNVGYLVAGRLFHPGDALTSPSAEGIEVLALPTAAPWLKVAEAVDYMRRVQPRIAIPIHDAMLAMPQMYYGLFDRLAPESTEVRVIDGVGVVEV